VEILDCVGHLERPVRIRRRIAKGRYDVTCLGATVTGLRRGPGLLPPRKRGEGGDGDSAGRATGQTIPRRGHGPQPDGRIGARCCTTRCSPSAGTGTSILPAARPAVQPPATSVLFSTAAARFRDEQLVELKAAAEQRGSSWDSRRQESDKHARAQAVWPIG